MPRWLAYYLALVPVFPPLYLGGFYGLRFLRNLAPLARYGLFGFFALELLAALFSPRPLLSLVLALVRALFVLGLIGIGVWLGRAERLGPLLYGYLVVYLVALGTSWTVWGERLFAWARLVHPYYTTVSLGLAGAVGILLAVGVPSLPRWVRILAGALALVVLLFAGSRGALLALFVGAMAAAALGGRRFLKAIGVGGLAVGVALFVAESERRVGAITRLLNLKNLSGRDKVWEGAVEAFRAHPLGGSGPYQLGPYLDHLYRAGCHLWVGAERLGLRCPAWLEPFAGAWLIAHNLLLHALGETGLLGTLGWAILYLVSGYAVVRARDPLVAAIFFGFLAMGLVDNPTLVPSLSLAEVFWVAVGIALARSGLAVPLEQGVPGQVDEPGLHAP